MNLIEKFYLLRKNIDQSQKINLLKSAIEKENQNLRKKITGLEKENPPEASPPPIVLSPVILEIVRKRWASKTSPCLPPYTESCFVCGLKNSTNLYQCHDCFSKNPYGIPLEIITANNKKKINKLFYHLIGPSPN